MYCTSVVLTNIMDLVKEETQPTQTEGTDTKQLDLEPADEPKLPPPATTATEHPSHSPNPQTTSTYSSASSSVSPTLPPPALFVNALNLQPHTGNTNTAKNTSEGEEEEEMETVDANTLTSKFKEDPQSVLKLLQATLPMEKLTSLIRSECRADKKKLKSLQKQLEEAYVTLSECAEQKQELQEKIEESTKKIAIKRKQMEGLREELRVLGEEELQLKKKRDISYAKCSEIKKKLKSSREAQQQIAAFSSAKPTHSVS